MTDRLITVMAAARIARVTQRTIHYWIETKRLPAQESVSTNPMFIKRSDLIAALPQNRIKTINTEHGVQLKSISQIARYLEVTYRTARNIIIKTGTTRHRLFKNNRETHVDIGELFDNMEQHGRYYALVPSCLEIRRRECGCEFCLMDGGSARLD